MYRVFLADDEPFIIEGLYDIVDWADLGLEIVGNAENGKQTVEALRKVPVDILVTDISMPEMNGLDCIREVRKWLPDLKVIILSGYDEFDYLKEAMHLGIENYLLKPVNIEELTSTLISTVEKIQEEMHASKLTLQDVSILRDHILYRWVKNQIHQKELEERAALLDLDLDAPFIQACLVRSHQSHEEVHQYVMKQLCEEKDVIAFRDMQGDTVILFKIWDTNWQNQVKDKLEQIKREWYGEPLRISLGSVQETTDVSSSYDHALMAQEYFLVRQADQIMEYNTLPIEKHTLMTSHLDWSTYSKLIMEKNKTDLLERVDHDFARLQQSEDITPEHLQQVVLELLVRFKTEFEDTKFATDFDVLYREAMEKIVEATSLEELVTLVKKVAVSSIDLLNTDGMSPVVQKVLDLIHQTYADTLSLKSMGANLNVHPVYLGKLFHKEVGENFTTYINKYRIEQAKKLLRESNLKIHEIATRVGYWESSYFYKQFKKYVGISPTDYKDLY